MKFDPKVTEKIVRMFGKEEGHQIIRMSMELETESQRWQNQLKKIMQQLNEKVLKSLESSGTMPSLKEIDEFLLKHAIAVQGLAIAQADKVERKAARMAFPKGRIPRNARDLQKLWDQYRKRGRLPPRVREFAEKVKKTYIDRCKSVFERESRTFREGEEATKVPAEKAVKAAFKTTFARAKTIVETETTRYYNQTRKDFYDRSPDVTHYLFLAIRDHRTTKWCKTRHGLVYEKGDKITEKEQPPVHWNCRSEVTPLTPLNPMHKALIDDASKKRRNNTCEPLPPGWNN